MQQDYILLKEAENAWLIEEAWDVMWNSRRRGNTMWVLKYWWETCKYVACPIMVCRGTGMNLHFTLSI
jgi:hypothetical protein